MNALTRYGWIPEWPKGTDCKSAATCFGGSNPPPSIELHKKLCRSGGTGRRPGLKIPWVVIPVPVRFRSTAAFGTEPDWFCSFFVNSVANFVSSCHNNCKRSRLPAKPESASFICSFISFYASAAFSSCSFSLASSSPSSTKRDGSTG